MSCGRTAALLSFSKPAAKTFNRMSSRYQLTPTPSLPQTHDSTPQPDPLINCTFCSTADHRDLSRLIKLTFVVALVMKTIMKTYLNYIIKTKLAIYQLSASWNIQTAIRRERERERQYGIGTISQHVSSRKNKKTK